MYFASKWPDRFESFRNRFPGIKYGFKRSLIVCTKIGTYIIIKGQCDPYASRFIFKRLRTMAYISKNFKKVVDEEMNEKSKDPTLVCFP
jgi:hypothetical protein